MKKIKMIFVFVMVIGLTGCSKQVDYTDKQVYVDYFTEQINSLNDEYLKTTGELFKAIGLENFNQKITDLADKAFEQSGISDLSQEDAKAEFDKFKSSIDTNLEAKITKAGGKAEAKEVLQERVDDMKEILSDNQQIESAKEQVNKVKEMFKNIDVNQMKENILK